MRINKELNICWTKDNPEILENYFHENMVAITPTDKYRREGKQSCVEGCVGFPKNSVIHTWIENDHEINIFGEAAVVTYYSLHLNY